MQHKVIFAITIKVTINIVSGLHLLVAEFVGGVAVPMKMKAWPPAFFRFASIALKSIKSLSFTEAILTGQQLIDLSIIKLTRILDLPIGWKDEYALLMN